MQDAEALGILSATLPTPDAPRAYDWAGVSSQLGTQLPGGYRSFCESWGRVGIGGVLNVEAPADDPRMGLVGFARWYGARHRDLRDDRGGGPPLWPERGGLLAWAWLEDGTTALWQTGGEPDDWTVVLHRSDEAAADYGTLTTTGSRSLEFLADWTTHAARRGHIDVTFIKDADSTPWLGAGDSDEAYLGTDRDGDRWRCLLTVGEVLQQPHDVALEGFLGDLRQRHPRLHDTIIDTRIRHSEEQLVVAGGWRGKRRCQRIGEAARRYVERELERQARR